MNLKEFRQYCIDNSDSFSDEWDFDKFKIICQKCKSDECGLIIEGKQMSRGSTQTGMWTRKDSGILVKCNNCGHAMILGEIDSDFKEKE